MKKRGQLTLLVILSLLIVAVFALYLILFGDKGPDVHKADILQPQEFIEKCVRDSSEDAIRLMLRQGGYIESKNYMMFDNNKVEYLCYTDAPYEKCVNQEPLYITHLENEIKEYITPEINRCFNNLKLEYENRGYSVSVKSESSVNVRLRPKLLDIRLNKILEAKKNDESLSFTNFNVGMHTAFYDLAVIALGLVNGEAESCEFDYVSYMIYHPAIEVKKTNIGNSEKLSIIYTLRDKITEEKLYIAIKGCRIPAPQR